VDLSIAEGEFVTLLGPSGCGKSTLLKMVAGMLEPTDGRLLVWRKPVSAAARQHAKDGVRVPVATLMPWASVQTNVRLPLDLAGVPRKEADARVPMRWRWWDSKSLPMHCRARSRAACRCACRSRAAWSRSPTCC
jgi:ABC-type nitrate/sulfonate/bicarbonate transport system ATPase subunit